MYTKTRGGKWKTWSQSGKNKKTKKENKSIKRKNLCVGYIRMAFRAPRHTCIVRHMEKRKKGSVDVIRKREDNVVG